MTPIDQTHGVPRWLGEAERTGPPPYHNDHPEPQQIQTHQAPEPLNISSTQGYQQHELGDNTSQLYLHEHGNTTCQPIQDEGQLHLEERDISDGRGFSILIESIRDDQQNTAVHIDLREAARLDVAFIHDSIYYDTDRNTVQRQMPRPSWRSRLALGFFMMAIASGITSAIVLSFVRF